MPSAPRERPEILAYLLEMNSDEAQNPWTSLVLLERVRSGDERAAEALFLRYFERLTSLARSRLSSRLARRADPEDIVMSVYRSFFVGARSGRFNLARGGDLWRLLASITKHKLCRHARYQRADCRSVDAECSLDQISERQPLARQNQPTPEETVALADELEWALARLSEFGRRVLELRLQGLQLVEIAHDTGRSQRTVRRRLASIRELLAKRLELHDHGLSRRFPSREESIRAELCQIDREIVDESASPGSIASPAKLPAAIESQTDPVHDGRLLSHHDVLLRKMIGSGLMGKVYEAWQHSQGRAVAVKFLRKAFLNQPVVVERFIDEAKIIGRLSHPNIVGIHGLGRTPGRAYFIVMELVSGPNLAVLGRTRAISVGEALRWTMETCAALEHAHARGIIHCDLKPANLLLDENGSIRVTDFGLARTLSEQAPWTCELEGTAPFMAPEQASRFWGNIDCRTDVYGVGAVLYTLLTGRPPWIGRRLPDIVAQVISGAPVIPPSSLRRDLPAPVNDVCSKCLSKAPEERYRTLEMLRSELAGLIGECSLNCG